MKNIPESISWSTRRKGNNSASWHSRDTIVWKNFETKKPNREKEKEEKKGGEVEKNRRMSEEKVHPHHDFTISMIKLRRFRCSTRVLISR